MSALRLTNTLTRTKEEFRPIDPAQVRVYACGPTVYDFAHIGNARPVIVFDVLFRLLRHLYGPDHVTYVRNITDVDDKINARAAAEHPGLPLNEAIRRVTEITERQFHDDIRALGVLTPADVNGDGRVRMIEPRATEHIGAMREMIDGLVARGHAYAAADHVLFSVPSMADYGQLSRRPLDEMEAGARVDVAPYKRSPLDFVLWKPSKTGEPSWPSPAGIASPGRPGWHIECSAMAAAHLGQVFDIHAGGLDLIFPHHENEIAQSRCCFGTPVMANVWLHNGFLQVEGEKMSKSLGNFVTIREVLASDKFGERPWPGEALRLAMLKTHYRQPINWTVSDLEAAADELSGWAALIEGTDDLPFPNPRENNKYVDSAVITALCDDLNSPEALKEIRRLADEAHSDDRKRVNLLITLEFLGLLDRNKLAVHDFGVLGINLPPGLILELEPIVTTYRAAVANNLPQMAISSLKEIRNRGILVEVDVHVPGRLELRGAEATGENQTIESLIDQRVSARAAKNWAESDRIRDELKAMGVQLKDNKDGTTTWEVVR